MLKIFIEKFILAWLPSAVISFFKAIYDDNLWVRNLIWYVSESLKTAVWVSIIVVLFSYTYIEYSQPIFIFIEDIVWDIGLNEFLGLNMEGTTRAAYALMFMPLFIVTGVAWRVSYKHKRRRAVLSCVAATETIRELKKATTEYEQLIIDILDVFSSIAVVVDSDFIITHCNDKYSEYCIKHGFEDDTAIGQSFCYIFSWLNIRSELLHAFSIKDKYSFIVEGRLGLEKRPYEIIIKPSGVNGSKKLFVFIKDIQDIQTYVTKPE